MTNLLPISNNQLLVIVLGFLLIGTFPYIDNWAHLGGFVFGIVSAIVFLPYITFGLALDPALWASVAWMEPITAVQTLITPLSLWQTSPSKWDKARKQLLLAIAFPALLIMFILAFVIFYNVQNNEFCSWCNRLNCIEWTSDVRRIESRLPPVLPVSPTHPSSSCFPSRWNANTYSQSSIQDNVR